MKKHIVSALSMALCLGLTAESAVTVFADDTKTIDSLKIAFSPYADSDTITTATEPLEDLLKETLLTKGYDLIECVCCCSCNVIALIDFH